VSLPGPTVQRQHNLNDDVSSRGSGHRYSPRDNVLLSGSQEPRQWHSLQTDPRLSTLHSLARDHSLSADNGVQFPPHTNRTHYPRDDTRMPVDNRPVHEHNLGSDDIINLEDDDTEPQPEPGPEPEPEPEPETEPWGHGLGAGTQIPILPSSAPTHNIELDTLVAIPGFRPREHNLSGDLRIPAAAPRRAFSHGIHLDEKVPAPELVRLNLDHDILQDRHVLTPSPQSTEHHLQADKKVKISNPLFPRQHSIRSDERMREPVRRPREHSLRADETVLSPFSRRRMGHSISSDPKVPQRAYRLLENFLEKDKKSVGKGPR